MAQILKNLPAMQETWVQSLDQEDPLEKGMATYSSVLAWRVPWTEEPVSYSPWGHKVVTFKILRAMTSTIQKQHST